MNNTGIENTAGVLSQELNWLRSIIYKRVAEDTPRLRSSETFSAYTCPLPELGPVTAYSTFVKEHELSFEERFLLILSLLPHIHPDELASSLAPRFELNPECHALLGIQGVGFKGYLPTGLTFIYLLAGHKVSLILKLHMLLSQSSVLADKKVISLEPHYKGEPVFSGKLIMAEEYIELFTIGSADKNSLKYTSVPQKA